MAYTNYSKRYDPNSASARARREEIRQQILSRERHGREYVDYAKIGRQHVESVMKGQSDT